MSHQSIVEAAAALRVERGELKAIDGLPGDPREPIESDLDLEGLDKRQQREVEWCFWLKGTIDYFLSEEDLRDAVVELVSLLQDETIDPTWRDVLPHEYVENAVKIAEQYVKHFNHGTVGHNLYVLVAKLAELLDTRAAGADGVEAE